MFYRAIPFLFLGLLICISLPASSEILQTEPFQLKPPRTEPPQAESLRPGSPEEGQVELPLEAYNRLVERGRDPELPPRAAPASYAFGSARLSVEVDDRAESARVEVTLPLRILDDDWVLVPLLPTGTAVESAAADGQLLSLIPTSDGLAWGVRRAGNHQIVLVYRVDVQRAESGLTLALPLPAGPSSQLEMVLPGTDLNVAVIPASGTRIQVEGQRTRAFATLPSTRGAQISWRPPTRSGHAISRARYRGEVLGDAVTWVGELDVDLFDDASFSLPVLPKNTALSLLEVDGEAVPILVEDGTLRAMVRGRGQHKIRFGFETPISRGNGPPEVVVEVPEVPISRFDLALPGEKEVEVKPMSNVTLASDQGNTLATVHTPVASRVAFRWTEAIPDETEQEVRANAGLYHVVYASEGVLYVRAQVEYEILRGRTHVLRFEVPAEVQVHRVESTVAAITDWRLGEIEDGRRGLTIFLDRRFTGSLRFDVHYDQSLQGDRLQGGQLPEDQLPEDQADDHGLREQEPAQAVPLLRSLEAQRQRGMVALLSSRDLALEPIHEQGATRVGENRLPSWVLQGLELPVSHTFKYVETPPRLEVAAQPPERKQGRFDVQVMTLVSLGDVSLEATSSMDLKVKAGSLREYAFDLPQGVNLLGLTGPSIRQHRIEKIESDEGEEGQGKQRIVVEFTQEMEGQFRLEVEYERLLVEGERTIEVPTLDVIGAEAEQGKIAVEALSAVEVQPGASKQLSTLDLNELPQQLILQTRRPVLLAYKYVSAPYQLGLEVTRHEMVPVQEAAIDEAEYRTLFTRDGFAVTTARFEVRNSGKQFLRIRLPESSEVWSALVDGRPEKPALSVDDQGEVWHLIKILHSTDGFVVELIFQSPGRPIRGWGTVRSVLPRPEILVTRSRWDVYLPVGVKYSRPKGTMELVNTEILETEQEIEQAFSVDWNAISGQALEPLRLRIPIPEESVRFRFQKLYANQGEDEMEFAIPFAAGKSRYLGRFLLAGALLWLGWILAVKFKRRQRVQASATGSSGGDS